MRLLLAFLLLIVPALACAERAALVIGNANHSTAPRLNGPRADAQAMALALTGQGYDVSLGQDLTLSQMYDALRAFRARSAGIETALVYFSGYGVQIGGVNYLVPVDGHVRSAEDAPLTLVPLDILLLQVSGAQSAIVVLDAGRDNPFAGRLAGAAAERGLGAVRTASANTLIAYSAAPGEALPDAAPGGLSPFTAALVDALNGPPAEVRAIFADVAAALRGAGSGPYVQSSLGDEPVILNPVGPGAMPAVQPEPAATGPSRDAVARALQAELKDRGCYRGGIDGILGRGSMAALARFSDRAGTRVSLRQGASAEDIAAALVAVRAAPGITCPAPDPVRRAAPAKPATKPAPTPQRAAGSESPSFGSGGSTASTVKTNDAPGKIRARCDNRVRGAPPPGC